MHKVFHFTNNFTKKNETQLFINTSKNVLIATSPNLIWPSLVFNLYLEFCNSASSGLISLERYHPYFDFHKLIPNFLSFLNHKIWLDVGWWSYLVFLFCSWHITKYFYYFLTIQCNCFSFMWFITSFTLSSY